MNITQPISGAKNVPIKKLSAAIANISAGQMNPTSGRYIDRYVQIETSTKPYLILRGYHKGLTTEHSYVEFVPCDSSLGDTPTSCRVDTKFLKSAVSLFGAGDPVDLTIVDSAANPDHKALLIDGRWGSITVDSRMPPHNDNLLDTTDKAEKEKDDTPKLHFGVLATTQQDLAAVSQGQSKNNDRPILTCVALEPDNNKVAMVATDQYMMVTKKIEAEWANNQKSQIVLPGRAPKWVQGALRTVKTSTIYKAEESAKIAWRYVTKSEYALFDGPAYEFFCWNSIYAFSPIEFKFPPWRHLFPKNQQTGWNMTLTAELTKLLTSVTSKAKKSAHKKHEPLLKFEPIISDGNLVNVEVSERAPVGTKWVTMMEFNKACGAELKLHENNTEQPKSVYLAPKHLERALTALKGEPLTVQVDHHLKPIFVESLFGNITKTLVMPLKIS